MPEIDVNENYEFELAPLIIGDYRITSDIAVWLKENMENITDANGVKLFGKVNYGYDEDILKSFGKKPVCNLYIQDIDFTTEFQNNFPDIVTSYVVCYLKGKINKTYEKACDLGDYLIQEFMSNDDFRSNRVVYDTIVTDFRLELVPVNHRYGVICALELEHKLKR